jgi:hydrogenase maturation protein HypF
VVQGVGFRPFVFRLARRHGLAGWVRNGAGGVEIHVEGGAPALDRFARELASQPPPAARIAALETAAVDVEGCAGFDIRESEREGAPTVRISPDLPVCASCLAELFSGAAGGDRRRGYPYINCTDCGPRYSIVLSLPYDRPRTTMHHWPMCPRCAAEYDDPLDRRFHAQPTACPACGPHVLLRHGDRVIAGDEAAVTEAARLLAAGQILAIKGIGGYHLACDACDPAAVAALRARKHRGEKPFALMARDLAAARGLVELSPAAEALLTAVERPIVLAPALAELPGVAPENLDLGVMLPYAPLHDLLFARGAPEVLVMTSANRSDEPIAYEDGDALARLAGIADAFLVGERPIARRVDDSICRVTALGPAVLRRARGYAPSAAARLPATGSILALGADLKSTITLVVGGEDLRQPAPGRPRPLRGLSRLRGDRRRPDRDVRGRAGRATGRPRSPPGVRLHALRRDPGCRHRRRRHGRGAAPPGARRERPRRAPGRRSRARPAGRRHRLGRHRLRRRRRDLGGSSSPAASAQGSSAPPTCVTRRSPAATPRRAIRCRRRRGSSPRSPAYPT